MDEFSAGFHKMYINTLKRRFGTKRVHSNIVYQEYINDREHVHMNSTRWLTLTDYVQWIGKIGVCVVDETEKGWFVTYIDRDPETVRRQEEADKKKKLDLDDQQRQQMYLERQIEKAKEKEGELEVKKSDATELLRNEEEESKENLSLTKFKISSVNLFFLGLKIEFTKKPLISSGSSSLSESKSSKSSIFDSKKEMDDIKPTTSSKSILSQPTSSKSSVSSVFKVPEKRKASALDEIIKDDEKKREKMNRKDYWLHKVNFNLIN
jgi:DNA/RNA-binding protein KIN17